MSLMICPDCGHECSTTAVACPQCGHPFAKPVVPQPRVIVKEVPQKSEFPTWVFVPLAILGAVVIFFLIYLFTRQDETANQNINVRVSTTPVAKSTTRTEAVETSTPYTSSTPLVVTQQPPISSSSPQTITTEPVVVATPPDKGTVSLEAKVLNRLGNQLPVTKETFYLLDKDLQSILSEADIDDPEGQGVTNSFGLSVVNPGKYPGVKQKALAAINRHIVYKTITDSTGKAQLKDVKPSSYYLFGITATRNGFAIWDSPVSVQAGDNSLILEPKTPTEITIDNE